jgi:hypothetical protein
MTRGHRENDASKILLQKQCTMQPDLTEIQDVASNNKFTLLQLPIFPHFLITHFYCYDFSASWKNVSVQCMTDYSHMETML